MAITLASGATVTDRQRDRDMQTIRGLGYTGPDNMGAATMYLTSISGPSATRGDEFTAGQRRTSQRLLRKYIDSE